MTATAAEAYSDWMTARQRTETVAMGLVVAGVPLATGVAVVFSLVSVPVLFAWVFGFIAFLGLALRRIEQVNTAAYQRWIESARRAATRQDGRR